MISNLQRFIMTKVTKFSNMFPFINFDLIKRKSSAARLFPKAESFPCTIIKLVVKWWERLSKARSLSSIMFVALGYPLFASLIKQSHIIISVDGFFAVLVPGIYPEDFSPAGVPLAAAGKSSHRVGSSRATGFPTKSCTAQPFPCFPWVMQSN